MPRVCQLSPKGRSAICVLRVAGPGHREALRVFGCDDLPAPTCFTLRKLRIRGLELTEQALLLVLHDAVEIHVHGNPLLVAAMIEELPVTEASSVTEGLQSEIESLAIAAVCPTALEACLYQLSPAGLLGLVQDLANGQFDAALSRIDACTLVGRELEPWLRPTRVLLRGRVNAGKSTYMNLLLGRKRVRTGPKPALTRDPVGETIVLQGLPIFLVDSAGIAPARDPLDVEAMELAESLEGGSACSVWLVSTTEEILPQAKAAGLRIWTHVDLAELPAEYRDELSLDLLTVAASLPRERLGAMLREELGIAEIPGPPRSACLSDEQASVLASIRRAVVDERSAQARRLARELLGGT